MNTTTERETAIDLGAIVSPIVNGVRLTCGDKGWFEGRVVAIGGGAAKVRVFAGSPETCGEEMPCRLGQVYRVGRK